MAPDAALLRVLRKGHMPQSGAVMDQSNKAMEVFRVFDDINAECDERSSAERAASHADGAGGAATRDGDGNGRQRRAQVHPTMRDEASAILKQHGAAMGEAAGQAKNLGAVHKEAAAGLERSCRQGQGGDRSAGRPVGHQRDGARSDRRLRGNRPCLEGDRGRRGYVARAGRGAAREHGRRLDANGNATIGSDGHAGCDGRQARRLAGANPAVLRGAQQDHHQQQPGERRQERSANPGRRPARASRA